MAKIIDFSKAKVQAISSGTILLFLYKNGETVQMSRSFMQMHEGLENVSVGDELEVVLKDSGKVAPNNRIYRYIGEIAERVDVRENINNEFKASFLNKVIGRAIAAGNNARRNIRSKCNCEGLRPGGSLMVQRTGSGSRQPRIRLQQHNMGVETHSQRPALPHSSCEAGGHHSLALRQFTPCAPFSLVPDPSRQGHRIVHHQILSE